MNKYYNQWIVLPKCNEKYTESSSGLSHVFDSIFLWNEMYSEGIFSVYFLESPLMDAFYSLT